MSKKTDAKLFDNCPHCGTALSPWEKVLLSVDRALTCRHCWYRILLDVTEKKPPPASPPREQKPSGDKS